MPWLAKLKQMPRGYSNTNLVFYIGKAYRVTKTGTRNVSVTIDAEAGKYVITADTARRLFDKPYWVSLPDETTKENTKETTSTLPPEITSSEPERIPENLPETNPKTTFNIDSIRELYGEINDALENQRENQLEMQNKNE